MKPSFSFVRLFSTCLLVALSCLLPHAHAQAGNFGAVNVGASSTALPVTLTFSSDATIGSTAVLTQGSPGLDFSDAGAGTCAVGTEYSAGQSCTINVGFRPRFSGTRAGAAVLYDANGNVLATGYVQGTGIGPQVTFLPGSETPIPGTSISNPHGIAVDGSGNIYVSDDNGVEKETYSNGSYSQSTIASGLSGTNLLAIDGAGNLYIAEIQGQVIKETRTSNGYSQSTVDSGFGYAYGVAVDGAGNVYIADAQNGRILQETPSAGGYVQSTVITGLSSAEAVAVDGGGNIYVGYAGGVVKETWTQGAYVQSGQPFGRAYPNAVVVDGSGNVYITDSATYNVYKETPTSSGYVESSAVVDLHDILGPWGVALDGSGAMYIAYLGGNSIVKADFTNPPALNFASTPVGTTSPDSPLTVTFANDGNAPLALEIPAAGSSNPSVPSNFTLGSNDPEDCPTVTSTSASPAVLAPETNCQLSVSYTPETSGPVVGNLTMTDNNLNAAAPAYASQSVTLNGTSTTPTFTISASPNSVSLIQGNSYSSTITITPQSGFTVDASLSVSGLPSGVTASFSQNPTSSSSVLTFTASSTATPGNATVTVTGTFGSVTETATISLQVTATPDYYLTLSASPSYLNVAPGNSGSATITTTTKNGYNSAISLSTCSPPITGATVTFTPSTIAAPGNGSSTMTITVSPNGAVAYNGTTGSFGICVQAGGPGVDQSMTFWLYVRSTPVITWPTPASITYGTALSASQLDATANVQGTFAYSPAAGTVLAAGSQTLNVTFTPTDTNDYTTATATVQLTVNKATPVLSWPAPAAINYGTALSASQLDATANVPGTFAYTPAAGTILPVGTNTLNVVFTPTDGANYATATGSVTLVVNPPPSYTLAASPSSLSIKQGGKASSTISVNPTGGFTGSVSLSVAGLPKGVTATISPNPATTMSSITFTVGNGASLGTTPVSVTGKSGSIVQTATITLTVAHK